jgi:hypothetical protein
MVMKKSSVERRASRVASAGTSCTPACGATGVTRASTWRRLLLFVAALAMVLGPSCTPGFDPPSKVSTLRILAVTMDNPYAQPGEEVTMRMTVHDGLGEPGAAPRALQVLWISGCVDPEGDQYFLCFEQLAETFAPLAQGGLPPPDVFKLEDVPPELNGVPDALEFSFRLPDDIVSRRPPPQGGPHYGIAYVFFAACAGRLAPTELVSLGGEVPEFPLNCLDEAGNELGPESFIIGYTQVYSFADGRENANPPIDAITLDGVALPTDPADAPTVEACPVTEAQRRETACGSDQPVDDCRKYLLGAMIGDHAEIDADNLDVDGNPLREVVWVSYFIDGGDLDPSLALVNDATKGYLEDFDSEWTPPDVPGLYTVWAVVRDQRGGSEVKRGFLRVE